MCNYIIIAATGITLTTIEMKQTTLNRFIDRSSSESDDAGEEYVDVGSKVRKSDIHFWTKVQARAQMAA